MNERLQKTEEESWPVMEENDTASQTEASTTCNAELGSKSVTVKEGTAQAASKESESDT